MVPMAGRKYSEIRLQYGIPASHNPPNLVQVGWMVEKKEGQTVDWTDGHDGSKILFQLHTMCKNQCAMCKNL